MAFDLATARPVEPTKGGFDLATARPIEETDAPTAPERGMGEQLLRAAGRTARAGIEGVTAIPAMLANAPAALVNKIAQFMSPQTISSQVTGERGFRFPDQTGFGKAIADALGLPHAENATERVVGDMAAGMAGAGGLVKAGANLAAKGGTEITRRIGELLATRPALQVAAGATGPGAAGTVREAGGGPVAQVVAGVAGGMAPAAPEIGKMLVRGAARGGEAGAKRVADTIKTFEEAGAGTPTVAQATGSRAQQALESGLAKAPGGAGTMVKKAEAEAAGMGQKVDDMASALASRSGAEPTGRAIRGGIDGFVEGFKARAAKLYDKVDRFIAPETMVSAPNTLAKIAALTKPIAGAKETSKLIQTPKLAAVGEALATDAAAKAPQPILSRLLGPDGKPIVTGETLAQPGGIPYQALKELRSAIGAKLSNPSLVDDVPTGQWKLLYGALTKDMGAAARAAGPQAEQAMVKASNYYRGRMDTIENVLQPILRKADPEDVFKAAISGTNEGATTIRGVVKSIPQESRKMLAATVLRRLGKATAGKQDDLGEVFSTETFLTNWNRITPDSKKAIFSSLPDGMRADLDKIAKVAANVREGSKVFANPSGTAQAAMLGGTVGSTVMAFFTGHPLTAAGIASTPVFSYGAANLMTNQHFVRWLAQSTRVPIEQLPAQANALAQLSWQMDKEDRADVLKLASALKKSARATTTK